MNAKLKAIRERCVCPECGAPRKVTEEQREQIMTIINARHVWLRIRLRRILDVLNIEDIRW